MGLFDRIKKAISNDEEENKKSTEEVENNDVEEQDNSDESVNVDDSDNSVEESADDENSDEEDKSNEVEDEKSELDEEVAEEDEELANEEDQERKSEENYDQGLKKSRNKFSDRFNAFLANFRTVDEDFFDDLEQLLIESDVGYETALRISDELREEVKLQNAKSKSEVADVIIHKMVDIYEENDTDDELKTADEGPTVYLFVGVNGAGKTTTVGKLAYRYKKQGKKVLLIAGDTFRAGATEQLEEWGKRVGVDVVSSDKNSDPASVVYDGIKKAKEEDYDVVLVDTAGRLQNNENLMHELEKIKRVIKKELPDAPHEVLLVLDGSTGQNALNQAREFNDSTDVTGIVMTKLDGSAQGGIIFAIKNELNIPVKLVGLGEQMTDLEDFDSEKFVYSMIKDLISDDSKDSKNDDEKE